MFFCSDVKKVLIKTLLTASLIDDFFKKNIYLCTPLKKEENNLNQNLLIFDSNYFWVILPK
jgi:hypothetical protein